MILYNILYIFLIWLSPFPFWLWIYDERWIYTFSWLIVQTFKDLNVKYTLRYLSQSIEENIVAVLMSMFIIQYHKWGIIQNRERGRFFDGWFYNVSFQFSWIPFRIIWSTKIYLIYDIPCRCILYRYMVTGLLKSIISSWNMQLILTNIQEFNGRYRYNIVHYYLLFEFSVWSMIIVT